MQNFIRRVKRYRQKHDLPELKYVAVTEVGEKSGRIHHHIVMSGGIDINTLFECASLDGTEFTINQVYELKDKFFLLSRPEIYGTWDSTTYKDGELLDYYDGLTNTERKKYDNGGTVRNAWLRSPIPSYANSARVVYTDGSLSSSSAYSSLGVAPACIIA